MRSQPRELTRHKNKLGLSSSLEGNPGLVEKERLKLQEKEHHERKKELFKTGIADKRNSLKLA